MLIILGMVIPLFLLLYKRPIEPNWYRNSGVPTSDSGKFCTDGSQCEGHLCLPNLTIEQLNQLRNFTEINATGICTSTNPTYGCNHFVDGGKVSRIRLCRD